MAARVGIRPAGSDEALVARIALRETAALVELYNRFGAPLYSYALKTLGDRGDAEEAVQDSLVKIWDRAPTFDPARAKAFTWCFMLTKSICFDRLRRRGAAKRSATTIPLEPGTATDPPDTGHGVLETLHFHEELARVREALAGLHPTERHYIELALFGEISYPEIAEAVDEPLGTVKSRIRRGMIKLRRKLSS